MSGYLNIAKVSGMILKGLEKSGDLNVCEHDLFLPMAGEISSDFFEVVLGWMAKQGVVTRTEARRCWSVSLTARGLAQRQAQRRNHAGKI